VEDFILVEALGKHETVLGEKTRVEIVHRHMQLRNINQKLRVNHHFKAYTVYKHTWKMNYNWNYSTGGILDIN